MTNSGSATVKVTLPTPANQKPAATTAAVYPTNNATDVSTELRFVWKEAVDPDGDKLTYILEYSTDQETWTTVGASQGIKSTGYADGSKTLTPETKYYWRVTSWDMFGEKSDPSETFSFTTGSAAAGTWTDGEARLYQDNTNGSSDAFTIIVSGDGFTADEKRFLNVGFGGQMRRTALQNAKLHRAAFAADLVADEVFQIFSRAGKIRVSENIHHAAHGRFGHIVAVLVADTLGNSHKHEVFAGNIELVHNVAQKAFRVKRHLGQINEIGTDSGDFLD